MVVVTLPRPSSTATTRPRASYSVVVSTPVEERRFDDLRAVDVLVPNDAVAHAFADHPLWGQGKLFDLWTIEEPWEVTSPTVELTDDEAYNCIGLGGNHLAYEIYNDWGDVEAVTAASTYYVPTPKRAIDYILSGRYASLDEIEAYCQSEILDDRKERHHIAGFAA